jgi:hypothetical protein
MLADLVLRSVFPQSPPPELVERFLSHLRETGEPESFPQISTTRPPVDGHVEPLALNLIVPGNRRARGNLAPCPICSSRTPKWAHGGTLIWCEATQAIYAIGPDCYSTLWTDGRLDREINRLRRTQQEMANLHRLRAAIQAGPAKLAWIAQHRDAAQRVSQLHGELARAAPRFRGAVARALKGSMSAAQQIVGHGFIRGSWKLPAKLEAAEKIWLEQRIYEVAAGLPDGLDELSPRVISERLESIRDAQFALEHVHDRLAEAAAFLTPTNVQALARWGAADDAPIHFRATHTATRVQVRCEAEAWDGPLGLARPEALP